MGKRYGLNVPGFTHTGREVVTHNVVNIQGLHDQDSIHNVKKLINATQGIRELRIGNAPVLLSQLDEVRVKFRRDEYRLRKNDTIRKGLDRQDYSSCERILSDATLTCLKKICIGFDQFPSRPDLKGSLRYFTIVRQYVNLFFSKLMSLSDRILNASYIIMYFRLWRSWVRQQPLLHLDKHFISREVFQDIILSCHFVINMIRLFRDFFPKLNCPLHRCGSDCCETFFSSLGSYTMNKHTFTFLEALNMIGKQNLIQCIRTQGDCVFPVRNQRRKVNWDHVPKRGEPGANMRAYPSEEEMIKLWKVGVEQARKHIVEDGMVLKNKHSSRWMKPWLYEDPKHVDDDVDDDAKALEEHEEIDDISSPVSNNRQNNVVECCDSLSSFLRTTINDHSLKSMLSVGGDLLQHLSLEHTLRIEEYEFINEEFWFNHATIGNKDSTETLRLGHIPSPPHYVLLLPTESKVTRLQPPDPSYYSGIINVRNATTQKTVVCRVHDHGMYPWGRGRHAQSNSRDECLMTMCQLLNVQIGGSGGHINCCSLIHLLVGVWSLKLITMAQFLVLVQDSILRNVNDRALLSSVFTESVSFLATDEKISATVSVPHLGVGGRMHKRTIVSLFNEGKKVSSDRLCRIIDDDDGNCIDPVLDLASATWCIGLSDNVAIKFDYDDGSPSDIWFCRIYRIRKCVQKDKEGKPKSWIDYRLPVNLEDRKGLTNVYVYGYYYRAVKGIERAFTFDYSYNKPISIECVISPVTMLYDVSSKMFTIPQRHLDVVTRSLQGDTSWNPEHWVNFDSGLPSPVEEVVEHE